MNPVALRRGIDLLTAPAERYAQRYAAGFESSTTALANANRRN